MTCRAVLSGLLALAALLGLAPPASSDPRPAAVGSSQFVVQPDPRLCPSPLCGGYWVVLANRARTRCSDGLLRPRCYVAQAVAESGAPLAAGLVDGALVRADIRPWKAPGFGELGRLVVADVRTPIGKAAKGVYYRVRDLGVRCIRFPCPAFRVARLNGSSRATVSSVDLVSLARPTEQELARAEAALREAGGLLILGRIVHTREAGRIMQVSRLYLEDRKPRA